METFTIIHIITDNDLVSFKEKVQKYCEGKTILKKRYNVTAIPIPQQGGLGIMSVPSCLIIHECTEQEWKTWKFGSKLKLG